MRDLTLKYPELTDALREACGEFAEHVDEYGCYADNAISEVSAASYDGFIAHTNGGFSVTVPCTLRDVDVRGMTDFEESILRQYVDSSYKDAAEEYIRQSDDEELREAWDECLDPIDAYEWLTGRWGDEEHEREERERMQPTLPGIDAPSPRHDLELLREELYEMTDHWLTEGAEFFYELRVLFYEQGHRRNSTGEDEIYIFAGINTDFTYGREKGLETAIERDYKLSRLTPNRVRVIAESFAEKL